MKLRNKVLLAIVPLMLITIISINIAFGLFFRDFILEHEKTQVNSVNETVSLFLNEKKINMLQLLMIGLIGMILSIS